MDPAGRCIVSKTFSTLSPEQNITISEASHQLWKNLPGSCLKGKLALQSGLTIEFSVSPEFSLLLSRNL